MNIARRFAARSLAPASLVIASLGLAAPLAAGPLSPNAGVFAGEGTLDDGDGNQGTWQASGTLARGEISGTLAVTLAGKAMTVTMRPGSAFMENGRCILKGEEGRNRFELSGTCDTDSFGPGYISGYFDGGPSVSGRFSGALRWGPAAREAARAPANAAGPVQAAAPASAAAPAPAPVAGTLPTARLLCGYRERIGGVVAGEIATYENRVSLMGYLQLSAGGTYSTRQGSGRFTREGSAIRLVSGPWAGTLGQLEPDNSGEPAVYFERDDNRRADGTPLIDPYRTFCVRQR